MFVRLIIGSDVRFARVKEVGPDQESLLLEVLGTQFPFTSRLRWVGDHWEFGNGKEARVDIVSEFAMKVEPVLTEARLARAKDCALQAERQTVRCSDGSLAIGDTDARREYLKTCGPAFVLALIEALQEKKR